MPDCNSPKCHEEVRLSLGEKADSSCLRKMLPKKAVWAAIPVLLAALGLSIGAADYKYAKKEEVEECKREQAETSSSLKHIQKGQTEARQDLKEARQDIKEILRHLRDKP